MYGSHLCTGSIVELALRHFFCIASEAGTASGRRDFSLSEPTRCTHRRHGFPCTVVLMLRCSLCCGPLVGPQKNSLSPLPIVALSRLYTMIRAPLISFFRMWQREPKVPAALHCFSFLLTWSDAAACARIDAILRPISIFSRHDCRS